MAEDIREQVEDLREEVKKYLPSFQFKMNQIEDDMKTIDAQGGQRAREFLPYMRSAATQYRDSVDTIQIVIQNLDVLTWSL